MIRNNTNAKEQECFFVFDNILGESEWARSIRRRVIQFAKHRFNVLVTGPVGTGKRLIAHSLHEHGPRRRRPFIPVDCAHLAGDLFRVQLFGHAYQETTTLGCFRAASGGTLYLANADLLDDKAQSELLETLKSKSIVPHGTSETHSVDVRVIAGSRKNLEDEVRQGRFRSDLYRRLSALPFETTLLSSRVADIELIANHLVAKLTFERGFAHKKLTPAALDLIMAYHWAENVSEIYDVIDDAICRSKAEFIEPSDLSIQIDDRQTDWMTLADAESKHIRTTLNLTGGDTRRAAAMLSIDEQELQAKLAKLRVG